MTRIGVVASVMALGLFACDRPEPPKIHGPGSYTEKLDASGRRHIVSDGKSKVIAKIRVRKTAVRVYDAAMHPLGDVGWDQDNLVVTRRGGEAAAFEVRDPSVAELTGRVRVERVERGWAVFDPSARRLGYLEWLEDGRLALRDDYSAAPRVFATTDGAEARTPSGEVMLTIVPPHPAAMVLPLLLEGELDALDRVAVGMWLERQKPAKTGVTPARAQPR